MRASAATLEHPAVANSSAAVTGSDRSSLTLTRDPLRVALFLLTILTISRVHESYPILSKLRPALLLVLASVGYAYLYPRYLTRANILKLWPIRCVVILAVLACCSTAFGISLGGSASFILDSYAKTLAYGFLIALSIRQVRDLYTFVWAYVVGCGVLAFLSIFVFGITKASNSYVTRLNNLNTYDSNDLGVVMMVGMPLAMLLLTVERGARRWLVMLVLLGIAATMARSGSRGGFLGFIAVALAALFMVRGVSTARRITILVVGMITLAVSAPPGYWRQMSTIMNPEEDYNYSDPDGRKAIMQRGLGYMEHYPVFGLGIDNFNRAECTISPKLESVGMNDPLKCVSPHNSYVQAGSELGVGGLIVFAALVIGGIYAPLRLGRRLPKSWRRGSRPERFLFNATSFFAVAMVGFAVTSFFVSFAWRDPIYVMASLLAGLYVSARGQLTQPNMPASAEASPIVPRSRAGWRVRRSAVYANGSSASY